MADRYDVQLTKQARKGLNRVDRPAQVRILKALALLRDHPRPAAAKVLVGQPGYLRVRVGDYRIVYTVQDDRLLVLVLATGHRRHVYDSPP